MDVRLSLEQAALRDAAAMLVDRLGPTSVGDLDDAERVGKLDAALAGAGWRELRSATDDGTPLASAVEAAIVAEELGRRAADTAFIGPTLAAELRRLVGVEPSLSGETVAFSDDLLFVATSDGDGGPPRAVAIDAAGSSHALLVRSEDEVASIVCTPIDAVTTPVDLTRPIAVVDSSAFEVVPDQRRPLTERQRTAWTALGLALTCADLVGTMRGAIELGCSYVDARRQFGVAVGSFQAVQHLLADAQVAMEGSRSVTLHAAWAVDALPPDDALAAAAVAKAYCARAARAVCESVIQVHGGIGNTWECFAHVHLRRALVSADLLGGVGPNLDRVLAHREIGASRGLR